MRFLIDANMPRSTAGVIVRCGHDAFDVRDIGLGAAGDAEIARHAVLQRLVLITRDFDFADIRSYPPANHFGLVVLQLPEHAVQSEILTLLETFLRRGEWVTALPGRLAIVGAGRVRFRPPMAD